MLQNILDKRLADSRLFDVDCTDLLSCTETIQSVGMPTVDCDGDDLTVGTPVINAAPIHYYHYNRWAPAGKVVQVEISGGSIPSGAPYSFATLRFPLVTTENPVVEATVQLRLINSAP